MATVELGQSGISRVVSLRIKNYRTLRDLELKNLAPFSVLLGPNGSGKSTVFDVFAFLSECFSVGLRDAWEKRGRFKELRSRGAEGPIVFELKYQDRPQTETTQRTITYHLAIDEARQRPFVSEEWLQWRRGNRGRPFRFLHFRNGSGMVITGEVPDIDKEADRMEERLDSPEMLAVSTLGQLARHPRVAALRRFVAGWYLSYISAENTRQLQDAGAQERLSATGSNLPNVVQHLKERHPQRLEKILTMLSRRVPRLERVDAEIMADGRLLLQIKDAPFDRPVPARFASDGTLKMLAYLTLLYDPAKPPLIGIEEPENHLHPRLLPGLAEECRAASGQAQVLVTTHSPAFVNGLRPNELWVLRRNRDGYTEARLAVHIQGVADFVAEGAQLGDLWMEGHLELSDPR